MLAMYLDYPIQFLNSIIEKQNPEPNKVLYQHDYSCMSLGVKLQVSRPLSIWLAAIEVPKEKCFLPDRYTVERVYP